MFPGGQEGAGDITKGEHSKFFEMMCRMRDVNIGFNGRTINE
jgi:hypothetical protein